MCIPLDPKNTAVQRCAGVLIIMATLWISEAIPLSITALLPVVLFPLLDIMGGKVVASQYFNDGTIYHSMIISSYLLILGWFLNVISYGEMEPSYAYSLSNHALFLCSSSYAIWYHVYCSCSFYLC